jgi:hypothetical protein
MKLRFPLPAPIISKKNVLFPETPCVILGTGVKVELRSFKVDYKFSLIN